MKQEVSEKVKKEVVNILRTHTYLTESSIEKLWKLISEPAQSLQPNIVGEGEKKMIKRGQEHWKSMPTLKEEGGEIKSSVLKELIDLIVSDVWNKASEYFKANLPIQPLQNGKSIEECKDEVSKELGYKNYYDFKERVINGALMPDEVDEFIDKVSQLYASQHPLQNGRGYTKEQMKQMAIQISDWKDGYTGKSDNRDLHTVVNDFLSSLTPAQTENEAVEFAEWIVFGFY